MDVEVARSPAIGVGVGVPAPEVAPTPSEAKPVWQQWLDMINEALENLRKFLEGLIPH